MLIKSNIMTTINVNDDDDDAIILKRFTGSKFIFSAIKYTHFKLCIYISEAVEFLFHLVFAFSLFQISIRYLSQDIDLYSMRNPLAYRTSKKTLFYKPFIKLSYKP